MVRLNRDKQSKPPWFETNTVDALASLDVADHFERVHIHYADIIAATAPHIEPQVALRGTAYGR
jgi:hypothetical protein